jgi:hypothetical protein
VVCLNSGSGIGLRQRARPQDLGRDRAGERKSSRVTPESGSAGVERRPPPSVRRTPPHGAAANARAASTGWSRRRASQPVAGRRPSERHGGFGLLGSLDDEWHQAGSSSPRLSCSSPSSSASDRGSADRIDVARCSTQSRSRPRARATRAGGAAVRGGRAACGRAGIGAPEVWRGRRTEARRPREGRPRLCRSPHDSGRAPAAG